MYPPTKATNDEVKYLWTNKDLKRISAEIAPLHIIGTLHSHPGWIPHITKQDIQSFGELGETVLGIYSFWMPDGAKRPSTDLTFYTHINTVKVTVTG